MNDKKIIFMGTPHIAAQHLQYLIDNSLNIIASGAPRIYLTVTN